VPAVDVFPGEEEEEDIADVAMFARVSELEREDTDGLEEECWRCSGCDVESLPEHGLESRGRCCVDSGVEVREGGAVMTITGVELEVVDCSAVG
jgi:hypothetical protein